VCGRADACGREGDACGREGAGVFGRDAKGDEATSVRSSLFIAAMRAWI
jgi:hypothetical protein